jgi:hypothetical protein
MADDEHQIDMAFTTMAQLRIGALFVNIDPFFIDRREQIAALAARHAIPAIYPLREFAMAGGLMSYGADRTESNRQTGIYVGRILKGEKPADLPVQQVTKQARRTCEGDRVLPAIADKEAVSAGLSLHGVNRSSHRLSNCRHRCLLTQMAFQFAQFLFCPFVDGTAERQMECDGLSLHSSNRSFHRLCDSRRRRLLSRIALQFADILFCPFTAGTAERQTE